MNSHLNRIDLLDALNVVLKCQTYYTVFNRLLSKLKKCMK